tara:strand:- start:465 stop:662 length:198 start_codon:yes stop_codon:yes gene_type:complete
MSDGGSSSAAAQPHGIGQASNTKGLTEQNMMKAMGHIDPRIGSAFEGSSNSGSDITLHLFNRLRA